MTFERFSRSYQLRIQSAADLASVLDLDEALWVATSVPIETLECDEVFLRLLDVDGKGRISAREVMEAIRWLLRVFADMAGVDGGWKSLRLASLNTEDEQGQRIALAAEKAIARLGPPGATEITLSQVRTLRTTLEAMPISEAGTVLPEAAADDAVRQLLGDIVGTVGGVPHPSGARGVDQHQLDEFLNQAKGYLDWVVKGDLAGADTSDVMPLGDQTPEAYEVYAALRVKIDQYFAQCRAVAFDARAGDRLPPTQEALSALNLEDLAAIDAYMQAAPLAKPNAGAMLPLDAGVNPAYAEAVARLRELVVQPIVGPSASTLSPSQWETIRRTFAPHDAWIRGKVGAAVAPLGWETLATYMATRFREAAEQLIDHSRKAALDLGNVRLMEKAILYQANLLALANNFVSMPSLYRAGERAMIERGTLIMDSRRFTLAVPVADRNQHAMVAGLSNVYVLYVEVGPGADGKTFEVAVPMTAGGVGNLCVGKRGIFHTCAGAECDARIVRIIENPINLRETLVAPFRRLGKLITGKLESITTTAESSFDKSASVAIDATTAAPTAQAGAGKMSGMALGGALAGGGVALAAMGSSLAFIISKLADVGWTKAVLGVVAVLAMVIVPTTVMAYVRLRRRDLSAILEGCGLAVNARMRLTFAQGRAFTQCPRYPLGWRGVLRRCVYVLLIAGIVAALVAGAWHLTRSSPKDSPPTTAPPASASS